jgi:hypothetical membrane protein
MSEDDPNEIRRSAKDIAILDFTKHLATLASAGLALIGAFASKTPNRFIVYSIAFFSSSLLLSVVASGISLQFFQGRSAASRPRKSDLPAVAFVSSLLLAGVSLAIAFALFAIAASRGAG